LLSHPRIEPEEGAFTIANGEGDPLTNLLLEILDGAPKLGTLTTITCQEGTASKIFGFDQT
jgi:hypothetical protein